MSSSLSFVPSDPRPALTGERSFDVMVADEMPLDEQRPTMLMWHGCGSDPEKFQEESEMNQRPLWVLCRLAARHVFYLGTERAA